MSEPTESPPKAGEAPGEPPTPLWKVAHSAWVNGKGIHGQEVWEAVAQAVVAAAQAPKPEQATDPLDWDVPAPSLAEIATMAGPEQATEPAGMPPAIDTSPGSVDSGDGIQQEPAGATDAPSVREALADLVACKDLKDKAKALHLADSRSEHGDNWLEAWAAMREEYRRRKPLAWERARAALASSPAPAAPSGVAWTRIGGAYYAHPAPAPAADEGKAEGAPVEPTKPLGAIEWLRRDREGKATEPAGMHAAQRMADLIRLQRRHGGGLPTQDVDEFLAKFPPEGVR